MVDQTLLPTEHKEIECRNVGAVWEAIKSLRVRGAPAIGVAAAYGAVIGARTQGCENGNAVRRALEEASASLRTSRPTAVNLFWALDRMVHCLDSDDRKDGRALLEELLLEAQSIDHEDRSMCRAIGQHGASLVRQGNGVLTHCNAGGLATTDYGTALGVIFAAHEQGTALRVYADETRPLLQGARLTAWELKRRGIPVTLICDNMAAQVMREGKVQLVVVGADRIASNGDTANKIGTYGVAVLAQAHGIPFYVAAPLSTFDPSIPDGASIPIEQRDPREVTHGFGRQTAPSDIDVYNPAFDVTPAALIAGIITEKGVISAVKDKTIHKILGRS
jgi:methylthioribose-1-phosphate isomerase